MPTTNEQLTAKGIVGSALVLLGRPARLTGQPGLMLELLQQSLEYYTNLLGLHDGNYLLSSRTITLQAGVAEYTISDGNWGDPLLCETYPEGEGGDAPLQRWEVDFVPLANQADTYRSPNIWPLRNLLSDGDSWYGLPATVTWWRTGTLSAAGFPVVKLRFNPPPQAEYTFRIFFNPGAALQLDLADQPNFLDNFRGVLVADLARLALPESKYDEPEYTRRERVVMREQERREAQLRDWIESDHREQSGQGEGWQGSNATRGIFY